VVGLDIFVHISETAISGNHLKAISPYGYHKIKNHQRYVLVETEGVEPSSKDIATQASTRVVDILVFHCSLGLSTGFVTASLINLD